MAKIIAIQVDDELYKKIKIYCLDKNLKMKNLITNMLEDELKRNKI